jgi:hypothetical protein
MTRLQGEVSETAALFAWVEDGNGVEGLFCDVCELVGRISQAIDTANTKNRRAENGFIIYSRSFVENVPELIATG